MNTELVERLAREAGFDTSEHLVGPCAEAFARLVAEECARVCEREQRRLEPDCAQEIRAHFGIE